MDKAQKSAPADDMDDEVEPKQLAMFDATPEQTETFDASPLESKQSRHESITMADTTADAVAEAGNN